MNEWLPHKKTSLYGLNNTMTFPWDILISVYDLTPTFPYMDSKSHVIFAQILLGQLSVFISPGIQALQSEPAMLPIYQSCITCITVHANPFLTWVDDFESHFRLTQISLIKT